MAATYEPIATFSPTNSASVDFTSIASTWTDLVLIGSRVSTANAVVDILLRFNGDTGSNYSITGLYGNGSSAASFRQSNQSSMRLSYTNGDYPMLRYNIQNYANTTTYKTVIGRDDAASNVAEATVGLWRSTSAITSISIFATSGNINGGTFTLYGIKAA